MNCTNCGNGKIQKIPETGIMACRNCGVVYDESLIAVDQLEFGEDQNVAGTFINMNRQSQIIDSSQRNLNKTYKIIEKTARILTIPENVVIKAKRIYIDASKYKFTQGRKTELIVGAILYLACRINETKHLLIDFSEALRINLFLIGSLYIKLSKLIGEKIKIIDPSLYMHRFCNKFNLGNKASEVEKTALKILQFMKRDWITEGRRPTGLCGACILISAKLHKLNIDITLISKAVHVCPQTIVNRIDEFSLTRVASMTMEEFATFNKFHFFPGADPPAFLKAIKEKEKEKEKNKEEEEKEKEIKEEENEKKSESDMKLEEKIIEKGKATNDKVNNKNDLLPSKPLNTDLNKNTSFKNDTLSFKPANSGLSQNNNNDSLNLRPRRSSRISNNYNSDSFSFGAANLGNDSLDLKPFDSGISKGSFKNDLFLRPRNSGNSRSKKFNDLKATSNTDEKLSNIPDNEDYKYIYSKDEYGVRKQFWEIMFKDWIELQKDKEEKERKEKKVKVKEPRKKNKKMIFKPDETQNGAYNAIKSINRFGKKINHSYIKLMLSKRK